MPIGQTNIVRASHMGSAKSPCHSMPVWKTEVAIAAPHPLDKSCFSLWYSSPYNKVLPLFKEELKMNSEQRKNENNTGHNPRNKASNRNAVLHVHLALQVIQSLLLGAPSPCCGRDGSLSLPQHNTAVAPSPLLLVPSVRHQRKPCAVLQLCQ